MRFRKLGLDGLWLTQLDRRQDQRGSFARCFCAEEFAVAGLPSSFPQVNLSTNQQRGTLRGLHWQADPFWEGKLVRCIRGAVFDVAVDLRPGSATHLQWEAVTLSAENGDAVYIPPGCAHGFQTLEPDSELVYFMTEPYHDGLARGIRWDDPALAIAWPLPDPVLSERDAQLPLLG